MSYWDSFTNFLGFGVENEVGNGRANHDDDVERVKSVLRDTGYYPSDRELHGTIDRDLDEAIRRFQKDRGLRVDGWLGSDGETERALKHDAQRNLETGRVLARRDDADEGEAEASSSVRFDGAMQIGGGILQAGAGALAVLTPEPITTALGAGAMALGADNIWTGARKAWSGSDRQTATRQALEAAAKGLGADDQTVARLADGAELGLNIASPVSAGAGAARAAGYTVNFHRYPNTRISEHVPAFGMNVLKDGKRVFGAGVTRFNLRNDVPIFGGKKGDSVAWPSYHREIRDQFGNIAPGGSISRHRPYEGGW